MHVTILSLILATSTLASPLLSSRQCSGPTVNAATIALIKSFESLVKYPAPDPIGKLTVGYGHLCQQSECREVPYDFPLSDETASQLMADDLEPAQRTITQSTSSEVVLNANQYGALVSWAFNNKPRSVRASSLIERLNGGEAPNTVIAEELPEWIYAGGQTSNGLIRRRAAEVELATTPTEDGALPAC